MTYHARVSILLSTLAVAALAATPPAPPAPPAKTLRLDYYHTGNATTELFTVDRVVIEPAPWPGNPSRPIDDLNLGKYFFEVRDHAANRVVYSRGFDSIYGECELGDIRPSGHAGTRTIQNRGRLSYVLTVRQAGRVSYALTVRQARRLSCVLTPRQAGRLSYWMRNNAV